MSRSLKVFFLVEFLLIIALCVGNVIAYADPDPNWKAADTLRKAGIGTYAAKKTTRLCRQVDGRLVCYYLEKAK